MLQEDQTDSVTQGLESSTAGRLVNMTSRVFICLCTASLLSLDLASVDARETNASKLHEELDTLRRTADVWM